MDDEPVAQLPSEEISGDPQHQFALDEHLLEGLSRAPDRPDVAVDLLNLSVAEIEHACAHLVLSDLERKTLDELRAAARKRDEIRSRAAVDVNTIALLERGDRRQALTVLMETYGGAVWTFCRRTLGDPTLADDITQTVFVSAYERLGRWQEKAPFRTWLLGIARQKCLDGFRARRRFFYLGAPESRGVLDIPAPDQMSSDADPAMLERALEALPPEVRSLVLLRFVGDMTYDEIARVTGEPTGAVRVRIARALRQLKDAISEQQESSSGGTATTAEDQLRAQVGDLSQGLSFSGADSVLKRIKPSDPEG